MKLNIPLLGILLGFSLVQFANTFSEIEEQDVSFDDEVETQKSEASQLEGKANDLQKEDSILETNKNRNISSFLGDISPISLNDILNEIHKTLTGDQEVPQNKEVNQSTMNITADVSVCNNTEIPVNKTKSNKVTCHPRNITEGETIAVQIVNSSVLLNTILPESNGTDHECTLVLLYAPWCHFSASAAPHYNALARVYPTVHVLAVNAIKYYSLNTRYGTVAVPSLLLFHNGRAVAKFNESKYTLEQFAGFVTKYTGLIPQSAVNVTSADFKGPLPSSPVPETDFVLWFSWIFILACCGFGFVKSSICHRMVEIIRNNWREAEAQHEHAE